MLREETKPSLRKSRSLVTAPNQISNQDVDLERKGGKDLESSDEGTYFKALRVKGYPPEHLGFQTMKGQEPIPRFPATLASYVIVFPMDDAWAEWVKKGTKPDSVSFALLTAQPLMDKMRSADMIVRVFTDPKKKKCYALVSISEKRQKMVAQVMGPLIRLRLKKKDDEDNYVRNGGAWSYFKQHLAQVYEHSSEGTLFSSCQQCQIIEFLLNDVDERALGPQLMQKDACEFGNTTLMQLKKDEKILDYFYLHHPKKRDWLKENWTAAYLRKQPLEDVREYYGESVGLYFAWMGYVLTMLWVPAAVGLLVFIMGAVAYSQAGTFDSPYVPLFSTFMAVWAIAFVLGWRRLQLALQHEWDTVEHAPPRADRREFIQNKRTYKRLNTLSQKEEYYPDPIWRAVFMLVSCITVPAFLCIQMMGTYWIFTMEAGLSESLGGKYGAATYVFAAVEGLFLVCFMYIFDRYGARLLSDLENWQTDEEYRDARVTKYVFVSNVATTFCIYLWGLIGNEMKDAGAFACPGGRCYDYLMIKIPVLLVSIRVFRFFITTPLKTFFEGDGGKGGVDAFCSDLAGDMKGTIMGAIGSVKAAVTGLFGGAAAKKSEGGEGDGEGDGEGGGGDEGGHGYIEEAAHGKFEVWHLYEWYLEKVQDLLWVMLFSGVFPLLPLGILVMQIVDLRLHALELTTRRQRMRYECTKGLGIIDDLLDIAVVVGIMTQCCMLAFASNGLLYYIPTLTAAQRAFLAVALEHALLALWVVFGAKVAVPDDVSLAYELKKEEKKHLLHDMDHYNPKRDVVFYTSDDGEAFYGKGKAPA